MFVAVKIWKSLTKTYSIERVIHKQQIGNILEGYDKPVQLAISFGVCYNRYKLAFGIGNHGKLRL